MSKTIETGLAKEAFNVDIVRQDFPILHKKVRGNDLVYLDNAATSQKPQSVIEALSDYYGSSNANIHRAVHFLSEKATVLHDQARETVRTYLNAASIEEIVFTRGTTEAINLVASSFGGSKVNAGDRVLISAMEHHSNIVPWQMLTERAGAHLDVIPMDERGVLNLEQASELMTDRTRILAIVHVSNALGTINPVPALIRMAHDKGIPVLVDGAQSIPHMKIDVGELDADFFAFSGHKVYGPTGIGVLYGKREYLNEMPPYQGGGDMIRSVTFKKTTWNSLPYKFEAGTPDIGGAIALAEALKYLSRFEMSEIEGHEHELLTYATAKLSQIAKVRIIGTAPDKAGAISFVVEGVHPHDLGTFLDHEGVAIRTGHHCAQPVMEFYDVPATARVSFAMYNTRDDIDRFIEALDKTIKIFA